MADQLAGQLSFEASRSRPWLFFDPDYYLAQAVQTGQSLPIDSPDSYLAHYLARGGRAGLSPNRFFDEAYYLARYPGIAQAVRQGRWASGFAHYCAQGATEDYSPTWFFDSAFYESSNPDLTYENLLKGEFADRYSHYLRVGLSESRLAHWLVAALRLVTPAFQYPRTPKDLFQFLDDGKAVAAAFKPVLDYAWMKEKYAWPRSLRESDFIRHYLLNVKESKLSPSPFFDEPYYLATYPEIGNALESETFGSGYEHFILHGMMEGRKPCAVFDPQFYEETNLATGALWRAGAAPPAAFVHFLQNRAAKRLPIARPLADGDVSEIAGKAIYERRCAVNAGMLAQMPLPQSAPVVSIVIIGRENFEQTANCIISAITNTTAAVEIIVFDNGSQDRTAEIPQINPGIRYISSETNIGFTIAANRAAAIASGRVLLFLNNDTELGPQAIDIALARLDTDAQIGVVGAKTIRMHGKLQEAGCVLFNDGGCLGYGRDLDPHDGRVNFFRDVDFVSGCFLAVRRQDWEAMGGFDENFAPAYYEDTDFCVRIWERGMRVVYDPRILLWHYEYGSSSLREEALALMRQNQRYFTAKHKGYLSQCPVSGAADKARLRHIARPRVLFVEDQIPDPMRGMGFVRSASIVKALGDAAGLVSVFGLHNHHWPQSTPQADSKVEILTGFNVNNAGMLFRDRIGLCDVVWISRTHNLARLQEWRRACPEFFKTTRIVLDTEALAAFRRYAYAKLAGQNADITMLLQEELEHLDGVNQIFAVSAFDRDLLAGALQALGRDIPVGILGHAMTPPSILPRFEETSDIVLVGAYSQPDSPNTDAVLWFDREVRPLLTDLPGLRFTIAGSEAAAFAEAAGLRHQYHIVNNPKYISDLYKKARLMVAPTRFAAGIPMKVHEAASHGVPVVMTELLADQLGWRRYGAGVSTTPPEQMAHSIRHLALNQEAWQRCQSLQLDLIRQDCDPARFSETIRQAITV